MKTFQIKGTARLAVGKKSNKALRVQDLVPCVIYGGDKVVHFQAHENEFRKLIYTPKVYQTLIDVDGTVYNAFMQALQFHPVTDKLLHIDFLEIRENVPVKLQIPVRLDGYAKGIQQGGRLKANLRTLKAKGFSKDFPDEIIIDVTELNLSESIRVGDVHVPGIEILNAKTVPVATVVVTRAARAAMADTSAAAAGGKKK
ncbi:MAG TPA: 50S ribosomal protein L25/general stress protein Ctc [Prolixibacteraceae bacterium]|nr:50S ribosomal protein L25/general stress protein Ctc [Prolixibacteraceae bacterium]